MPINELDRLHSFSLQRNANNANNANNKNKFLPPEQVAQTATTLRKIVDSFETRIKKNKQGHENSTLPSTKKPTEINKTLQKRVSFFEYVFKKNNTVNNRTTVSKIKINPIPKTVQTSSTPTTDRILTIYLCGTDSTSFDNVGKDYLTGEMVAKIGSNSPGTRWAHHEIIDGPGSGNWRDDDLWTKPSNTPDILGKMLGWGMEENVEHAINVIKGKSSWERTDLTEENYNVLRNAKVPIKEAEIIESDYLWEKKDYGKRKVTQQQLQEQIVNIFCKDKTIPTQVNLVGWSRGGVTCLMIANAMLKDEQLKNIPVNIFAVDPVPGPFNFNKNTVTIGDNVREYVAYYALDERSKGFASVIPETSSDKTNVHLHALRGRHATLVGNAALNGVSGEQALSEPGLIVRDACENALQRWGVTVKDRLNLSQSKISELYKDMERKTEQYNQLHKHSYTLLTEQTTEGHRIVVNGDKSTDLASVLKPANTLIGDNGDESDSQVSQGSSIENLMRISEQFLNKIYPSFARFFSQWM